MKQQSWIILSLVFALIIAVFAIINVDTVEVDFLFMTTDAPLILVILLSVLMGTLLIVGFSFSRIYKLQREIKELKAENQRLIKHQQEETGESIDDSTNDENGKEEV
ncbi:LapA family protein [Aquisalibacillus elongatus]|uniref:Putative integral membrane protein n=1 Tax=Aquisalibacillus elongatus TaxID=485577 RepID=A0A3N5CA88_9BACI|nr:lipopolysaccharide assembly protein LapA domain-containing protein [Aquisalibacillus elongatus]RPF55525.1 putative integral membrane protein [Aquisalibacillus elongatus]